MYVIHEVEFFLLMKYYLFKSPIVTGDGQWLVNHRIDLWIFNDIY